MSVTEIDLPTVPERTSGVQELIDRIRFEGVEKGRDEAESLLAATRERAVGIVDDAQREADVITATARSEAQRLRAQAEESLRLAARDAVLALGEALRDDFAAKLRRLVSHTMQDQSFLKRLILEIARRAVPPDAAASVELQLPADVMSYEDLKRNPEELAQSSLSRFVLELSAEVLREGLTFAPANDEQPGLRIQLKDQDIEIDLTDEAVSGLLMEHLAPRFRALMDRPQI